jgi:hypothetical protein
MTIRLWRSGSSSFGLTVDDDGVAHSTSSGGTAVGRFARGLTQDERDGIRRGLAQATEANDADAAGSESDASELAAPVRPGATTEHLLADGLDVSYPAGDEPPEPYRELVHTLRAVRDDLAESAVAAIVLDVDGPPYRSRLRHVGTEPITVRMAGLTMTITRYRGDYTIVDTAEEPVEADFDGPIGRGWELPLPAVDTAEPDGGFVVISVGTAEIDVEANGVLRRTEFSWASE